MSQFPAVSKKKLMQFFVTHGFYKEACMGNGSNTVISKYGVDAVLVLPHTHAVPIGIIKHHLKTADIPEDYFRAEMQGGKKSR